MNLSTGIKQGGWSWLGDFRGRATETHTKKSTIRGNNHTLERSNAFYFTYLFLRPFVADTNKNITQQNKSMRWWGCPLNSAGPWTVEREITKFRCFCLCIKKNIYSIVFIFSFTFLLPTSSTPSLLNFAMGYPVLIKH